jgi:hypothetical protein
MKTFSVDYRSPPSGLGHVINSKSANPYDHILITYPGCGEPNSPNHSHTVYIDDPEVEDQGWIGPAIPFIHQLLKSLGVEKVYDSELGFDHPHDCDSEHYFKLEDWIKIMKSF